MKVDKMAYNKVTLPVRRGFVPKHHDWCSRITFIQDETNDQNNERNPGSMYERIKYFMTKRFK